MSIGERIEEVKRLIEETAPDKPPMICLATKTQTIEALKTARDLGCNIFGENRVQEFLEKYGKLDGVKWHFIGNLQTNKVKYIIDKVELIHSVDRLTLAAEIDRQSKKHNIVMSVLIEIKLADEEQKGGIFPDGLFPLVNEIIKLSNVKIEGLMTVMPLVGTEFNPYEKMKRLFKDFQSAYPSLGIKYLSMGMSGDYLTAIQYGSNILRLGRAIFGERVKPEG